MSSNSLKNIPKKISSKGPNNEDDEWENHLIIRFPNEIASKVDEIVGEDTHSNNRLSINFEDDLRNGTVRVDETVMPFKIYDLPCITEVMKTMDNKTVYKVTDLSQMIICSTSTENKIKEVFKDSQLSSSKETESKKENFNWPHGLTPPMKNARKCRFRKTKKKKYMDAPDVERELKRLLRSDLDAHSIRWEVVPIDSDKKKDSNTYEPIEQMQPIYEEIDERDIGLDDLSDSDNDETSNLSYK